MVECDQVENVPDVNELLKLVNIDGYHDNVVVGESLQQGYFTDQVCGMLSTLLFDMI